MGGGIHEAGVRPQKGIWGVCPVRERSGLPRRGSYAGEDSLPLCVCLRGASGLQCDHEGAPQGSGKPAGAGQCRGDLARGGQGGGADPGSSGLSGIYYHCPGP